ncbi:thioesterase family protein [Halioglobus maricola]|uniref:Thioesterase family protein n=1 Tax=Halioglobus maricola TaxID=2601894 RepID=A0A5P9NFK5_9GAMM|nr:thioesterase family protein [Halioglobus maricola]QFU74286.1 thioesterase family protein [Halioglobus maricola]
MDFAKATNVTPSSNGFDAEIHSGWDIGGNANGGYLMALAARAMSAASRPHPVSVTAHYLSPGRPGPVHISTDIVKTGRTFTTARATMMGPDKPILELLGCFGELANVAGAVLIDAEPPEMPPPEDCVKLEPSPKGFPPPLMANLDMRMHPEDAGGLAGKPTGEPQTRGWIRLPEEQPVDAFALMLFADAFPPTIFNTALPIGWVPTVEMTTQVRGLPEPGWLRCRFSTRFITGGMLEEDGEIWDQSGRLVALSRQLALTPRNPTSG